MLGMVGGKGTSLRELRDRAILLLGFSGAFRRSELVALNLGDIEWTTEGALVTIRRSKTDQEGLGRKVGIPRGEIACPVSALEAWLEAARIGEGAVFRRVFNRADPAGRGSATSCAQRRQRGQGVCDQTGHKSLEMLRVYTRDAELFAGNAAAGLLRRIVIGSHWKGARPARPSPVASRLSET